MYKYFSLVYLSEKCSLFIMNVRFTKIYLFLNIKHNFDLFLDNHINLGDI